MKNPLSLSRLAVLGLAFGGTAVQAIEKLKPLSDACPWLGPVSVVAGVLAGFGIKRLTAFIDKKRQSVKPAETS